MNERKKKQQKKEQISDRVHCARYKDIVADIFPLLKVQTFSGFLLLLPKKNCYTQVQILKDLETWREKKIPSRKIFKQYFNDTLHILLKSSN